VKSACASVKLAGVNPKTEVGSDLAADPFIFVRDSSLRYAPFKMTRQGLLL
jgi:hypothetical protein